MKELLSELSARLPELKWKMGQMGSAFSIHQLPRGLFRTSVVLTAAGCVDEIQDDIDALLKHQNENSAHFLAERIKQKINVLVALHQINVKKNQEQNPVPFSLNKLSTRQQWLQDLELEIQQLMSQQQALSRSLEQMSGINQIEAVLTLKQDLGSIEKRLTLAKETLSQATMF